MSLAPQELENTASKYASEAIKFDSQGARGMAITHYQQAIDALVKLLQLYPNSKLNQIYKERCNSYGSRLYTYGSRLYTYGSRLYTYGSRLYTYGSRLYTYGSRLYTYGSRL